MSSFCRNINMHFFLLVLTTLMAANPSTSTSSAPPPTKVQPNAWYTKWTVHVVNGLSNNKILLVHCKSKDDDLGEHHLSVGSETNWDFRENIWLSTKFWCFVASESDHVSADFDVFWNDHDLFYRCKGGKLRGNCIWIAKDDGIYLKNIPDNIDEFMLHWNSGTGLLAKSNSTVV